jgi:hypothetical protein
MDYFVWTVGMFKYFSGKAPYIKRVYKNSIMGNEFNKTLDYYLGGIVPSPLDDVYTVEYCHNKREYILKARVEHIQDALEYIEAGEFDKTDDQLLLAFETNETDTFKDITEHVRRYYGPENNFYSNTSFKIKRKFITNNKLYIIDRRYHIHSFEGEDDVVDIFKDGFQLLNVINNKR